MAARGSKPKGKAYFVTAPLVQVDIGGRPTQFRQGDVLPEGVSEDSIKHLESLDYVTQGEASAESDDE